MSFLLQAHFLSRGHFKFFSSDKNQPKKASSHNELLEPQFFCFKKLFKVIIIILLSKSWFLLVFAPVCREIISLCQWVFFVDAVFVCVLFTLHCFIFFFLLIYFMRGHNEPLIKIYFSHIGLFPVCNALNQARVGKAYVKVYTQKMRRKIPVLCFFHFPPHWLQNAFEFAASKFAFGKEE